MRHCAKFHQNRSHGWGRDKAILRFSKWRMSAILDLWNSNFLTIGEVKRPILHQRTKFRKTSVQPLRRCRDLWFQDGDRRHLGFSKIQNFNSWSAARGQCASPCQISLKIGRTVAEIWRFVVFFRNGGRPPSWICWAPIGTTHDEFLMVSIVVPNLVKIDAAVSITWNFQDFARLA